MTTLPPESELFGLQKSFTQHLRNPDVTPIPKGLDGRRVGIYRDLVFNNVSALMRGFFPVVYSLLHQQVWDALIREFFVTYRAETPYFPKLSDEFLQFLMARPGNNHEPEYLLPLAHYEWLELCLFTSEAELAPQPLSEAELVSRRIRLSELAIPVAYDYPVHQIQSGWKENRQQTCLLLFRDKNDDVRFFEIQPLSFELLREMQQNGDTSVVAWLEEKSGQYNQQGKAHFVQAGINLVQQFNAEQLFL